MKPADNTVEFSCACGKEFRARVDQGGRAYACPACGAAIRVPKVAIRELPPLDLPPSRNASGAPGATGADGSPGAGGRPVSVSSRTVPGPPVEGRAKRFFRVPKTVGHLLAYFGAVWGAIGLLAIVLSVFSLYAALVALAIFIVATVALGQQSWLLLRARQRVLVEKDVPLLWGMVRLIAWDPVEGVLVLRNKSVAFSDDDLHDGQGGVRFLYPVMGEELALRIPLEVQTLRFADENVLTQEYLSLTIRGTMKWRLVDVRKFYLLVSRELRSTTDAGGAVQTSASHRPTASGDAAGASDGTTRQLLNAAIEWLRVIAEEHSRKVVSRVKSGLLLADRVSAAIPEMKAAAVAPNAAGPGAGGDGTGSGQWGGAADGLAREIQAVIAERVGQFGIVIDDVSLQEIRLPDAVIAQCVEACKSYYLPLLAQRKAAVRRAELGTDVDLLGADAVAAREVAAVAPAYALGDFLNEFLRDRGAGSAKAARAALGAAAAAQIAGQLPAAATPDGSAN